MADETQTVDVSNPILGSLKVSGSTVNTIFTVFGFVVLCLLAWVTWTHQVDAKDADKSVITVLKENNAAHVAAMKESNAAVTEAIKQMAHEQRRSNEIGREQTCLLTLPTDRRTNAGEFCKRLSRERDR